MVAEYLQPITTWLHHHPQLAIIFAGFVAFLESLAIVGSIVPGSVTLTAIGILIGSGVIPIWETFISAIIGAILGDLLSYWIGHYYQDSLRSRWPFNHYPTMIDRGEQFFYKHGGKSIAIGRFFGPVRAVLPLVAGMLNMPFSRFLLADVISGIFWAPAYMLPGVLLGAATLELAPEQATYLLLMVLGLLVGIWFIVWLFRHTWNWIVYYVDKAALRAWLFMSQHGSFKPLTKALENTKRSRQHLQLVRLTGSLSCALLLVMMSISVIHHGWVTAWNEQIHFLLHNMRTEKLDVFMVAITLLGDKYFLATVVLIISAVFLYYRQFMLTVYWLANALIVTVIAYLLKHGISNPRPTGVFLVRPTSSFPSFHTAFSTAIYSFLSLLMIQRRGVAWQKVISVSLLTLLALIGLSRLYLGAHWFSDVIAGYLLGITCGQFILLFYHRCPFQEPKRIMHLWWVYMFALSTSFVIVGYILFPRELKHNAPVYHQHLVKTDAWWQQTYPILPKYRRYRDGTPAVLFNVQWLSKLENISAQLKAQGWQQTPTPTIITIMARLMAKDKTRTLPVLEPLFESRHPDLTMTKSLGEDKPLIVLRLWRANYQPDNQQTLWIGTVHYRILWQHRWLTEYQTDLPKVETILLNDTRDFKTRLVEIQVNERLHYATKAEHHQIILLRSK